MIPEPGLEAQLQARREWEKDLRHGSVWEQELAKHLQGHVEAEVALLREYEQIAAEAPDAHVRYLLQLLLEDEQRHHRVMTEMLNRVWSDASFRPAEPATPPLTPTRDRERVAELAQRLLDAEHDDARELQRLQRELRSVRGTSLLPLLVETLQLDTEKHVRILEFLKRSARL